MTTYFVVWTKLDRMNAKLNELQKRMYKEVYEEVTLVYICVIEMEVLGERLKYFRIVLFNRVMFVDDKNVPVPKDKNLVKCQDKVQVK